MTSPGLIADKPELSAHKNGKCKVVRHHISKSLLTDIFTIYDAGGEYVADVDYQTASAFMLSKIGLADVRQLT
jgi:hypothetical protein